MRFKKTLKIYSKHEIISVSFLINILTEKIYQNIYLFDFQKLNNKNTIQILLYNSECIFLVISLKMCFINYEPARF